MSRAALRRILLAAIALLYVLSIPWYRAGGEAAGIVAGLPSWVTLALACYVGVAILNSLAWLLTDIPDATPPEGEDAP